MLEIVVQFCPVFGRWTRPETYARMRGKYCVSGQSGDLEAVVPLLWRDKPARTRWWLEWKLEA